MGHDTFSLRYCRWHYQGPAIQIEMIQVFMKTFFNHLYRY